jgi:hypothetical protein
MAKRTSKPLPKSRPTLEQCANLIVALDEWKNAGGTTMEIIVCLREFVDEMIDTFPEDAL